MFDAIDLSHNVNAGIMIIPAQNSDKTTGYIVLIKKRSAHRASIFRGPRPTSILRGAAMVEEHLADELNINEMEECGCRPKILIAKTFDELLIVLKDNRIDEPAKKEEKK